jgi:L-ascorbate metabolism protein UlaG (beta-lactamase superfamily)
VRLRPGRREDAAAALDLLRPRVAVPMHYNTWPVIAQDPARFAALAAAGRVALVRARRDDYIGGSRREPLRVRAASW